MKHKKIFAILTAALFAVVSLAACQSEPSSVSEGSTGTSATAVASLNQLILYQNAQPRPLPLSGQAQFDTFVETVTQAIQSAGDTTPHWISSVVTEEWLEPYFENGEVLKITFANPRDFSIGSEHRTCDELLVIEQSNWVVFGKGGQYQSGPLALQSETIQEILTQAKTIE